MSYPMIGDDGPLQPPEPSRWPKPEDPDDIDQPDPVYED